MAECTPYFGQLWASTSGPTPTLRDSTWGLGGQGLGQEKTRPGPEVSKGQGRPSNLAVSFWRALGSPVLWNQESANLFSKGLDREYLSL